MTRPRAGRPGLALTALVAILVITAAWWALALWPAGAVEPEWLSRTRAACFGAAPGGLPDAGGWVLLIGEPVGMVGVLIAVWGRSLREEMQSMRAHPAWRIVGSSLAVVGLVAVVALGVRVTRGYALVRAPGAPVPGVMTRPEIDAPRTALTDQHGRPVTFAGFRGHEVLVTFAYGHCTTVCPTIVRDVLAARRAAGRTEVRFVVVTLDPWRDTPDRLPSLTSHWGLGSDDVVLSGAVADVEAVLDALGVGRSRNETTGDIAHGETVLLVDARGRIAWRLDGDWRRVGSLLAGRWAGTSR